jgi:hypothetical protein
MAVATKFQVKTGEATYSTRILCEDCHKEAVYATYLTETPSVSSGLSIAELKALPFPSCDVCEASFAGTLQAVR